MDYLKKVQTTTRLSKTFKSKPSNPGKLRFEMANRPEEIVFLADLIDLVGNKGVAFFPCRHKPTENLKIAYSSSPNFTINSSTAFSFNFLALDFDDSEISPKLVIDKCLKFGIQPLFAYQTFNDVQKNNLLNTCKRFRVIFYLEEELPASMYPLLLKNFLFQMFPSSDKSIGSTASMLFGGKKVIYMDEKNGILNTQYFLSLYASYLNNYKGLKSYKKNQKEISKNLDLLLTEEKDLFLDSSIYYNIDGSKNKSVRLRWDKKDWAFAQSEWPLLNSFFKGEIKLFHSQLYLLYLAMMKIDGGVKCWLENVTRNPNINTDDKVRKIDWWIKTQKKLGRDFYEPPIHKIDNTIPSNFYYYLSDIGKKVRNSKVLQENLNIEERNLDEARTELNVILKKFIQKNNILVKAPTGVGKTHALIDYLSCLEKTNGIVLAVPTHQLKDEISSKLREKKILFEVTPKEPPLNSELSQEINKLRKSGFQNMASGILKNVARGEGSIVKKFNIPYDTIFALSEYYEAIKEVRESNKMVVTTHEMILQTEFAFHSELIIDEDPTFRMLKVGSMSIKNLRLLKNFGIDFSLKNYLEKIETIVQNSKENFVKLPLPPKFKIPNGYYDMDIRDVGLFFESDEVYGLVKDGAIEMISFFRKRDLPDTFKRVIILSASANPTLLKKSIPGLHIKELGHIKLKGRLVQVCNRGYSKKSSLQIEHINLFKRIKEGIGNIPVITHQISELQNIFQTNINFNNIEGLNCIKGRNILIVGTPYPPEYLIPLIASALDIKFKSIEMDWMTIHFDGWIFPFRTYFDEVLRDIHLKYIQGLLLQAVGRARLAQEEKTVILLSKMPLPQGELMECSLENLPAQIKGLLRT